MSSLSNLLPVSLQSIGNRPVNAVDGRRLHSFMEVGKIFAAWMPEQIEAFGFLEHQDFEVISESGKNPLGGRPSKEYILSIPMAKELAMVQRTAKGKEARLYFLECERIALSSQWPLPSSFSEALALAASLEANRAALACKVQAQEDDIAALEPKAAFCDRVADAEGCHSIADAAKLLGTGQNRLFIWLRQSEFLIPGTLTPYQRHIDAGLFKVVEKVYSDPRGLDHLKTKTLITGKGLVAIQRRMQASGSILHPQHFRPSQRNA